MQSGPKTCILLKRNLNLLISPDQQDLLGPFRACFKSVLGPDFGPKSPESCLLGKNRTFPDRTQSGLHPYFLGKMNILLVKNNF